jgi:collagen type VII alpha
VKTKRKWIDLDYSSPTSLRAEDIPYDSTMSVKDAIVGLSITGIQGPIGGTGIQGPGVGAPGETGIQGITGLGDLQPGETGLQGPTGLQGITGLIGIQGITGFYGHTGIQGVTGFISPSTIPSAYATITSYVDATSTSFVDIPGLATSIILDSASQIFATMSFETESAGAGSYPTGAFRIVITPGPTGPDSSGTALEKFLLPDDVSLGSVTHYDGLSPLFTPGSYTVKGQFKRVSGLQKVRVNSAQIYAQSLSGGKGDIGQTGIQGVTGWGVQGDTGIAGNTGIAGATGIPGRTGIAGHTGLGVQGYTGIQGVTGIQGLQGITGVALLSAPPSNFVYFDSTHQLFDNTSAFIDIPGLSSTLIVDTSGAYIYSTLTLETDSTSSPAGLGYYITGSLRVVVDDQTSLEFDRFVQNDDDIEINTIPFRTTALSDGTHSIKGQVKVIPNLNDPFSYGDKYFGIRKGQLYAQALEGAAGPDGPMGPRGYDGATGFPGVTGILGTTGIQGTFGPTGIQGNTGLAYGATGIQGVQGVTGFLGIDGQTGIQGLTGLSLGSTGIQGVTGFLGLDGVTGLQGFTGLAFGTTGIQGMTGFLGLDGQTGIQGLTGLYIPGETGIQGLTGLYIPGQTGIQGNTGIQGLTGLYIQGQTGIQGLTGLYIQGQTGIQGITGFYGQTGVQGNTGIQASNTQLLFNPISRYVGVDTTGAEVWLVSSGTIYHGLDWTRSSTALTVNRNGHGHIAGNRVIVRNTNTDFQTTTIDSTTSSSFTLTTVASGDTSGNYGAYSLGFTYAHDGIPSSIGTITAPSGDHPDCQLISARIRTGARVGTTYALQVPASAVNGAGANTNLGNCYVPDFNVRWDTDTLTAIGATMTTNILGSYSTFEFGNLGTGALSRIILVHF